MFSKFQIEQCIQNWFFSQFAVCDWVAVRWAVGLARSSFAILPLKSAPIQFFTYVWKFTAQEQVSLQFWFRLEICSSTNQAQSNRNAQPIDRSSPFFCFHWRSWLQLPNLCTSGVWPWCDDVCLSKIFLTESNSSSIAWWDVMKRVGWYQDQDGQGRSPPVQIWRMGSPPPQTICFCGCSLTQLSRNSKGRTGEFENPDLINYVFCLLLRVQWLHNFLQKDRFNTP